MRLATAALALALVAGGAAGCGGGHKAAAAPRPECPLSPAQHRDIAAAKRVIVLMRRLEQPLKTCTRAGRRRSSTR